MPNNKLLMLWLVILAFSLTSSEAAMGMAKMVVKVPVVDLRREPVPTKYSRQEDPIQETQLIYGEKVLAYEEKDGWIRVEAIEQPEFTHNNQWEGYPGWVPKEALLAVPEFPPTNGTVICPWVKVKAKPSVFSKSLTKLTLGSRILLEVREHPPGWVIIKLVDGKTGWMKTSHIAPVTPDINQTLVRLKIVETAQKLRGMPYFWGGRSAYDSSNHVVVTGLDCSGLINLIYRAHGIDIPRDAQEQFMKSKRLEGYELAQADLIFLAKPEKPDRIVHVMMYAGKGKIIEASASKRRVRNISMKKRLGKTKDDISYGEMIKDWYVYFGTILNPDSTYPAP